MLKSFLIIINIYSFIYASQIILVVAQDSSTQKAKLQCFEDGKMIFKDIDVNIGKNGLGLGISDIPFLNINSEAYKREGDKKSPLGIFRLSSVFAYEKTKNIKMPYIYASEDLICVDDTKSSYYNQVIRMPNHKPNSFEKMRRDDDQYRLGVVVNHNKAQIQNAGSCIFIHVQKEAGASTAGCTSMKYEDLEKIVEWLDIKKNPVLIQIPRKYLEDIKTIYPELPLDLK